MDINGIGLLEYEDMLNQFSDLIESLNFCVNTCAESKVAMDLSEILPFLNTLTNSYISCYNQFAMAGSIMYENNFETKSTNDIMTTHKLSELLKISKPEEV